jgi:carboxyl-terminal processing protease
MNRSTLRLSRLVLIAACCVSLSVGAAEKKEDVTKRDEAYELYKVFIDTLDQVERNYVKEVDRRQLIEAAIEGMLDKLDPYSSYISPDQLKRFETSVESKFGGIGIQINVDRGVLTIISPLVGSPAYKAGLQAGDRVIKIEGTSTKGIRLSEAVRRLKGDAGTDVTLTVVHLSGGDPMTVTIRRKIIQVDTILGDQRDEKDAWDFMLDDDRRIGYIRLTSFSRTTAGDLRKVLKELQKQNMQGLVLDLRFNPGGLLSAAIEISDLFVSKGRIVSTEGRNAKTRIWDAHEKNTFADFPMVVLVNRYSASASEIVSACLQDHKRAVLMGERSFGKGSVQNVIRLEQGKSALKLTTAGYKRPSGKNIHRFAGAKDTDEWGVVPADEYRLRLDAKELAALSRYRRNRDVVRPHEKQSKDDATKKKTPAVDDAKKPETKKPETKKPETPPNDKPAADKKKPTPDEPSQPAKFVDRQLKQSLDYLTTELAKADTKEDPTPK